MKDNTMDQKELLARMWIDCDPNRQPDTADDILEQEGSSYNGQPKWKWFEPRAESSLSFLEKHGFQIVKK